QNAQSQAASTYNNAQRQYATGASWKQAYAIAAANNALSAASFWMLDQAHSYPSSGVDPTVDVTISTMRNLIESLPENSVVKSVQKNALTDLGRFESTTAAQIASIENDLKNFVVEASSGSSPQTRVAGPQTLIVPTTEDQTLRFPYPPPPEGITY